MNSNSQGIPDLRRIDSIATVINYPKTKATQDSIVQNLPTLGLFIKTYLTAIFEGNKLIKYVNYVKTDRSENGITTHMTSCNTFYFDDNSLIKVEEFGMADNQVQQFNWYFKADKCLYHSLQTERSDSRSALLISMSKEFTKTIVKAN